MTRFPWLLLFLFSAIWLGGGSTSSVAAQILTPQQISQQIVGRKLTASRMGMRVDMTYEPDGTVSMTSLLMSGSGSWSYSANGICMMMTSGPRRGKTCVTFEPLGQGRYVNSEGITLTVRE
ncbi:hypothetical protein [Aurantimonas marianensis]|uniref:Dihydrodipicolinate reductase n=1 Tax=Aurantimonas marianensis TaxID=2920428 RepID=A0A9X2H3F8_9HYPH|nr:hypothetical protein [Aurantimonas marianensis]MCP3054562.1 hypothetical protein [Aurantimonas marianensis]